MLPGVQIDFFVYSLFYEKRPNTTRKNSGFSDEPVARRQREGYADSTALVFPWKLSGFSRGADYKYEVLTRYRFLYGLCPIKQIYTVQISTYFQPALEIFYKFFYLFAIFITVFCIFIRNFSIFSEQKKLFTFVWLSISYILSIRKCSYFSY